MTIAASIVRREDAGKAPGISENDRRRVLCGWLIDEAKARSASWEPFPKGVVESIRASMQDLARTTSMRGDSRFGDSKTVKMDVASEASGMAGVYAKMREAVNDPCAED